MAFSDGGRVRKPVLCAALGSAFVLWWRHRPARYPCAMRQAENEPDVVADFVARHPEIVARLAGVAPAATHRDGAPDDRRARFRAYAAGRITSARSDTAAAAGQDFLRRLRAS